MKTFWCVVLLSVFSANTFGDTFDADGVEVDIEFVTIGNPGNRPDLTGAPSPAGSVSYSYRMAKYEFTTGDALAIVRAGKIGVPTIPSPFDPVFPFVAYENANPNTPVRSPTFHASARIVNWMNEAKGFPHAYKFALQPGDPDYRIASYRLDPILEWNPDDPGYDAANPLRNSEAFYFLPTSDEWYKAAYYDPELDDYWDYGTGSNERPTPVASGTEFNTAVYDQPNGSDPALVSVAGGANQFGLVGMAGNLGEWNERNVINTAGEIVFETRGCSVTCDDLHSSSRFGQFWPEQHHPSIGFRVASAVVPEPQFNALWLFVVFLRFFRRTD